MHSATNGSKNGSRFGRRELFHCGTRNSLFYGWRKCWRQSCPANTSSHVLYRHRCKGVRGSPPRLPTDRQLGANLGANLSLLKIGAEAPIEWSKERGEGNEAEGAETYAFYLPITVTADRSDPVHAGAPSCLRLCAALSQVSFVMKPPLFSYVYVVPSS